MGANYLALCICGAIAILFTRFLAKVFVSQNDAAPTVSDIPWLPSFLSSFRFITHAQDILQTGYERYHHSLFKVSTISRWEYVVSGTKLTEDIRRAPEDVLSFRHAANDNVQTKYTVRGGPPENAFQVKLVQALLSSTKFGRFHSELYEEMILTFRNILPHCGDEWVTIPGFKTAINISTRMSNRAFVGVPLCRNTEFIELCQHFTVSVMTRATIISLFPKFLQPIVGPLISPYKRNLRLAKKFLEPLVTEKRKQAQESNDNTSLEPDELPDVLSWVMQECASEGVSDDAMYVRFMGLELTSVHTTSLTLANVLFSIAANPSYVSQLRKEIEDVMERGDGWAKDSIAKLEHLDSFIRETMRFYPLGNMGIPRKVISPAGFTFSNGVNVPYGAFVSVALYSTQHDDSVYPNASEFDGFRFVKLKEQLQVNEEGNGLAGAAKAASYQATAPGLEFLPFGYGRRACPGRFFAVHEIKTIFAHLLITYDVKFKDGVRPPNLWIAQNCIPNQTAELMIRKRQ